MVGEKTKKWLRMKCEKSNWDRFVTTAFEAFAASAYVVALSSTGISLWTPSPDWFVYTRANQETLVRVPTCVCHGCCDSESTGARTVLVGERGRVESNSKQGCWDGTRAPYSVRRKTGKWTAFVWRVIAYVVPIVIGYFLVLSLSRNFSL